MSIRRRMLPVLSGLAVLSLAAMSAGQQMNEADMQRMMQRAGEMQACMAELDESALQALQSESEAKAAEVEALCAAGERDEAQDAAMAYAKEIAQSSEIQQMRKCAEMMRDVMPAMPKAFPTVQEMDERHVCD